MAIPTGQVVSDEIVATAPSSRAVAAIVTLVAVAMSLFHMYVAAFGPPEAFIFRGTQGFSAGVTPGELVVSYENNNTWIRGDINGDHAPELQIMLTGIVELTSSDFML